MKKKIGQFFNTRYLLFQIKSKSYLSCVIADSL